jgi:hypothetical protein
MDEKVENRKATNKPTTTDKTVEDKTAKKPAADEMADNSTTVMTPEAEALMSENSNGEASEANKGLLCGFITNMTDTEHNDDTEQNAVDRNNTAQLTQLTL